MRIGTFTTSLSNLTRAFLRGEILMQLKAHKFFAHIVYTFILFWLMILTDMMIENTLSTVEKNRTTLENLRIIHSQKKAEAVGFDRISTIEGMLKEKGSEVSLPKKPASRIDSKEP